MSSTATILIVDDERTTLRILERHLHQAGYETISAGDGQAALQQFYHSRPDLVILDVNMPGMDGWTTCQRIREFSNVPIIMLTAQGEEEDIVKGLNLGADDYIVKPFQARELLARVRANLRRAGPFQPAYGSPSYDDDYLSIDLAQRRVSVKGEAVKLSRTEFNLLAQLLSNAGRVVTFEQLLESVWGKEYLTEVDYVRVYISHLRRKIEEDPQEPRYLHSERGVGYRFERL